MDPQQNGRPHRYPELWDADWLRARYVDEQRTQRAIAAELGCCQFAVSKALRRQGIAARPGIVARTASESKKHATA